MKVFPFERSGDLMTVTGRVWGAHGDRELLLVIDTGATATSIEPAILEGLGYSADHAIMRTRVPTPPGVQRGHLFRARRFYALGAHLSDFVVQALALADEYGVDGLLGMNFLERFNFTVRPVERIGAAWNHAHFAAEGSRIHEQLVVSGRSREALAGALRLLRQASAAGEQAYQGADYDLAVACKLVGCALKVTGQAQQALPYLEDARRRFEAITQARSERTAAIMASICLMDMGDGLRDLGRFGQHLVARRGEHRRRHPHDARSDDSSGGASASEPGRPAMEAGDVDPPGPVRVVQVLAATIRVSVITSSTTKLARHDLCEPAWAGKRSSPTTPTKSGN